MFFDLEYVAFLSHFSLLGLKESFKLYLWKFFLFLFVLGVFETGYSVAQEGLEFTM